MKLFTWKNCIFLTIVAYLIYLVMWATMDSDHGELPNTSELGWWEFVADMSLCAFFTAITLLFNQLFFNIFQKRGESFKLFALFTCVIFIFNNLLGWAITYACNLIWGIDNLMLNRELLHLRHDTTLVSCIFCSAYFMLFYLRAQENKKRLETNLLEIREKTLQAQMHALKAQIDPHFMFNNFSILSGLIESDPDEADKFLTQLTKVYRYITLNLERDLIPVADEIVFLDSYLYLIRMRHGNNIIIEVDPALRDEKRMVPPATVQLLIENAIKHNRHSSDSPLNVWVYRDNASIVVSNPIQPLVSKIESTGMGHKNIENRYSLLGDKNMEINSTSSRYTVSLPLL